MGNEMTLPDTDAFGRDLHQFIVGNEFNRVFERELDRRRKRDGFVLAGRAHVGELLALDRIDDQIVVATVNPDDHALVELVARRYEHASALLQLPERVGHRLAALGGDQYAVAPLRNITR